MLHEKQKAKLSFLLIIFLFIMIPFGQVQAESKNKTVSDIFESDEPLQEGENRLIEEEETPPVTFDNEISIWDFIKLILALIFIVGLIYFILKFVNQKNRINGRLSTLQNIGGISLGQNRSIQLVRVGEKVLVVGVGESIQLLKEISPDEVGQSLFDEQTLSTTRSSTSIFNRFTKGNNTEKTQKKNNRFESLLNEQMSEINEERTKMYQKLLNEDDDR